MSSFEGNMATVDYDSEVRRVCGDCDIVAALSLDSADIDENSASQEGEILPFEGIVDDEEVDQELANKDDLQMNIYSVLFLLERAELKESGQSFLQYTFYRFT